jgi:signal transduction histidine kinase
VWNLLANAVKFTPDGGQVDVRLERADALVSVEVSDSGRGIEPELLGRIFDPFWQRDTVKRQGGLGLGLTIVRTLVEAHGGRVEVASEGLGRGATFRVQLPGNRPDAPPAC